MKPGPGRPRKETTQPKIRKNTKKPTSFNSESGKKASENSHTPEAQAKRTTSLAEKRALNRLVQGEVLNCLRNNLFEVDETTNLTWYERFLKGYMTQALEDPDSRAAQTLASNFFSADILSKLDAETDKILAKDIAFSRYRLNETLFEKQRIVISDRFTSNKCIICGRRSGKTELNARLLIDACLEPNTPCCYIHLTFNNGIAQVYDLVLNAAQIINLPIKSESRNDGVIEFTNGSVIRFRGNANKAESEKVRGFKYKLVIIDECQSQRGLRYLVEDIIQPLQLDFEKHFLILTGTPPRIPHTYFESAYRGSEFKPFHWDMRDNPFIPNANQALQEICDKKGLTLDSPLIQREYLGQIVYDTDALVYRGYKVYRELPLDFIPDKIYIGVDFGFSDYNAIITLVADTLHRRAFVTRQSKFNKATVQDIIDDVNKAMQDAKELIFKRNPNVDISSAISVICDTNEKSISFELSQTYRLPVYNAYKYDKMMSIAQLSEMLRRGEIQTTEGGVIADECEQVVYKRDDETDAILNEIDEDVFHPDAMDALLYASRMYCFDCGYDTGGQGAKL